GGAHGTHGDGDIAHDEGKAAFGTFDLGGRDIRWRRRRRGWSGLAGSGRGAPGGRHRTRRGSSARCRTARPAPDHVHGPTHRTGETPLTGNVELGTAGAASDDHACSPPVSGCSGSTASPTAPIDI